MKMKPAKVVGLGLMLSPFIAMTYIMVSTIGWLDALLIWGAASVMTVCVGIGVHLFYDKSVNLPSNENHTTR